MTPGQNVGQVGWGGRGSAQRIDLGFGGKRLQREPAGDSCRREDVHPAFDPAKGLIAQSVGPEDRRERRLSLTEAGVALEQALSAPQRALMAGAYRAAGAEAVAGFRKVLAGLSRR